MNVDGKHFQSIWFSEESETVHCIDQTKLPHDFVILELKNLDSVCHAIRAMQVRGAPLIGVAAAYGMYLALKQDPQSYDSARAALLATRPTAVNLQWALRQMDAACAGSSGSQIQEASLKAAWILEAQDRQICESIGDHGAAILESLWQIKGSETVLNVLTHCNAGWLATVDWGTALSVIYKAHERGVPLHIWVDETRPRNQGASLTCWELGKHGIAHTLITDNAGGHLMQHQQVDVCVVGSDRTTILGDVCNKIGTYLKALAANDNGIPFYVALPVSSIDFTMRDGSAEIPIEERDGSEVTHIQGLSESGELQSVLLSPADVAVCNPGFDVTPARLITGIITEKGVVDANEQQIASLQ
ncbi:MAG: S-methyl-5-thioribose-1-phosphate isomerase [Pseudohongiellaceae bacterium]